MMVTLNEMHWEKRSEDDHGVMMKRQGGEEGRRADVPADEERDGDDDEEEGSGAETDPEDHVRLPTLQQGRADRLRRVVARRHNRRVPAVRRG